MNDKIEIRNSGIWVMIFIIIFMGAGIVNAINNLEVICK